MALPLDADESSTTRHSAGAPSPVRQKVNPCGSNPGSMPEISTVIVFSCAITVPVSAIEMTSVRKNARRHDRRDMAECSLDHHPVGLQQREGNEADHGGHTDQQRIVDFEAEQDGETASCDHGGK